MPGHVFLRGKDIALRVVEQTARDYEILGRVRNEPAFRHDLGFDTSWPRSRVQEFVESTVSDESSLNLFICLRDGGVSHEGQERRNETRGSDFECSGDGATVIGAVNLFDIDAVSGTLSYWLFESHRGCGYATEAVSLLLEHAFNERGLHRVEAEVIEGNDSSEELLDSLGFVREGTARDARYTRGEFADVSQFGLLAPNWGDLGQA